MPPPKQTRETQSVTPDKFPSVLPPPGHPKANYDFAVQAVMEMQKTVGQLCEAVDSLKNQSRSHDHKIDESVKDRDRKIDELLKEVRQVSLDVHAAKASGKTLLWVMSIIGALIGICLGAYLTAMLSKSSQFNSVPSSVSVPRIP